MAFAGGIAFEAVRSPKVIWAVIKARIAGIGYGTRQKALEIEHLAAQFESLGLDYRAACVEADRVVAANSLRRSDSSLHYELFAGISRSFRPRRVLEIGTFRGEFTAYLSSLFPDAYIETWDLPEVQEGDMRNYVDKLMVHYHDQRASRLENLGGRTNVQQIRRDSTSLFKETETFDLIWVDGDHTFPVIAFDLINALRLSNTVSWIAIDDIKLAEMRRSVLSSTEGFRCIEHLVRSGHVTSRLIYKRVGASGRRWRDDRRRKHIAVLRRSSE
ncbi:MAG: hypothetical protein RL072_1781 [Actinomycetota bacterium]|jgi:predicted O-methyltransferase YrrM